MSVGRAPSLKRISYPGSDKKLTTVAAIFYHGTVASIIKQLLVLSHTQNSPSFIELIMGIKTQGYILKSAISAISVETA